MKEYTGIDYGMGRNLTVEKFIRLAEQMRDIYEKMLECWDGEENWCMMQDILSGCIPDKKLGKRIFDDFNSIFAKLDGDSILMNMYDFTGALKRMYKEYFLD